MSKVNARTGEYMRYLTASSENLNDNGRRNAARILSALGGSP
jgi:hypothetical protein